MVIYADIIFFINSISAYVMLYILGKVINNFRIRKIRILLSSLFGGLTATVIFCVDIPLYMAYTLRILSVFIMIAIAFYETKRQILRQFVWFVIMTGIMMFSMTFLVSAVQNTFGIVMKAGIMYFDISAKVFLIAFAGAYLVMIFFVKVFKNRKNKRYYIMTVTHNDKTITVSALFDSGNQLKEPITGKCVNILEWEEVRKLFGIDCDFSQIADYADELKLWVIPFNSLGNPDGILFAFLADNVSISEEHKSVDKTFIGIYGEKLSKNGEYHALINAGLL